MNCLSCGATTSNGLALCERCRQTLTVALVNTAAYYADVLRIQPGQRVKVRAAFTSAPPSGFLKDGTDPISEATDEVDNTVTTWVRVLHDDRPQISPPPAGTVAQCGWLERHTKTIATLDWADELTRDMLAAERHLRRILDRADTGWYAGRCGAVLAEERLHSGDTCACACHHAGQGCDIPGGCSPEVTVLPAVECQRGLYATPGHNWIRCPECGATHDVRHRRDQLLSEARDEVAPIRVISKILVGMLDTEVSEERLAKRLDKWVERGQLVSMGIRVIDRVPRRVYRVGDVWDTLVREQRASRGEAC